MRSKRRSQRSLEYDRLHRDDRGRLERTGQRARLVQDAGDALWCFMVQREACGLRDPRPVLRDYRVPVEVQNRMGIFAGRRRTSST